MRWCTLILLFALVSTAGGEQFSVYPSGQLPDDDRLGELRTLNSYFPFQPVESVAAWQDRQTEIKRRILVSQGLWPLPTRAPLNAVIHGRVERDDYVVDRVYFESIPGHFVTGSLYRPKQVNGRVPAILSPHGHWSNGRFYEAGASQIETDLKSGAEKFDIGGRFPIQARAVHLARMGCIVFVYDMTGNADSIQIQHRPDRWSHLDRPQDWGFMSVQADLRLQNMMGLQTWNSIRAIDFLTQLDDVDPTRIGVTGASGGGTQSMIIGAIDARIAAAMPCVMVSTAMQGGCTCENAPLLRIDQGNVDIAAAIAPRPLGLTAADDWTVELETKGYPDLVKLYRMVGKPQNLTAVFHTRFPHNYNAVNRAVMYEFFNRHFDLGVADTFVERDFKPLSSAEATVWTDEHPAPSGDQIGDAHEVRILQLATRDAERKINQLLPQSKDDLADFQREIGGAWNTILGRSLSEVGNVDFTETARGELAGHNYRRGQLIHRDQGEILPAVIVQPAGNPIRGTVVWIDDHGKEGLLDGEGWSSDVQPVLEAGYQIISADLFGQGEFVLDGNSIESQPMWYQRRGENGWERFSGYTFGYNHPLFVKRVHDTLMLIKFAGDQSDDVLLVGLGPVAGPVAAAARTQTASAVEASFVDLGQFRFESLARHDDPMFVPGAVKYLDVEGLLSLNAPGNLTLVGKLPETVRRVYQADRAESRLQAVASPSELIDAIVGDR